VLSKRQRRPDILAQWARFPIPVNSSAAPAMRRERLVNAVARSMLNTQARPSLRRRVFAVLAAAVAIVTLAVVGGTVWRGRTTSEPVAAHLVPASPLATGHASPSQMQLRSGVEVTVGPETLLTLPDARDPSNAREELVLELGLVRVKVPKLPRGHFFAVRTPDTVVSVHGTAFSVEVTKSGLFAAPKTTVIVTEGVVSVQHSNREILLDAGAEWTSSVEGVDRGAPESSGGSAPKPGPATTKAPAKQSEHAPATATSAVLDPDVLHERTANQAALANQNRLFSEAMRARDHGDGSGALGLLEDFIQRYPGAPLAQDAYVERFRVLAEMGKHAAAARAARSYLALYPTGFAGVEARQLALEAPAGP
jgi:FecR protein